MTAIAAVPPLPRVREFSLERRLMLRLGGIFFATLLIMSAIYGVLARSDRHIEVGTEVDQAARDVAGAVHIGADGARRLDLTPGLRDLIGRMGDRGVAVIDRDTGRIVDGSAMPVTSWPVPNAAPTAAFDGDYFVRTDDRETWYAAVRVVDTEAGRFAVEFRHLSKRSDEARAWIWDELGNETVAVLVPLLGATLLMTWLTLRTSLRPLRRVAAEAQGITSTATGRRLGPHALPREIQPVVAAANDALDRVETALREQQRLMANVAHELRTPLAILRARIENLTDEAAQRLLVSDFERVATLVDRLLAVARLQSKRVAFDRRYEIARVVRDAMAAMAPLALRQDKELALTAPDTPIVVCGNPAALGEAMRNLIDNALRFTEPGGLIEVTVSSGCVVAVRDRGPGIPAEALPHLFEPFWRGDGSGNGSGLGLAIAQETAKRHGGRLTAANVPDGGAVVRLEIPQVP